jgi:hypothetical protein
VPRGRPRPGSRRRLRDIIQRRIAVDTGASRAQEVQRPAS